MGVRAPIDLTRFRVLAFDFAPEFGEGVKDARTPLTITTQDQARLLALRANPALVDRDGLTAAQLAAQRGHTRLVELLEAAR